VPELTAEPTTEATVSDILNIMNQAGISIPKPVRKDGNTMLAEARKFGGLDGKEKPEKQNGKEIVATLKTKAPTVASSSVNWSAAFLLYSRGMPLDEIAREFHVELSLLRRRCRSEEWDNLVKMTKVAPDPAPIVPRETVAVALSNAAERVAKNREEAVGVAFDLRSKVREVLAAYKDSFMRPEDILTLAKAAKLVDETSMIALGDERTMDAARGIHAAKGGGAGTPTMNIFMPGVLIDARNAREMRNAKKAMKEIIDAAPEAVSTGETSAPEVGESNESQMEESMDPQKNLPRPSVDIASAAEEMPNTPGVTTGSPHGFTIDFAKLSSKVKVDDEKE